MPILSPGGGLAGSIAPANVDAVKAIVADYRARMKEVVEQAVLPHKLPSASEIRSQNLGVMAGPRKPALETAFKPMGYGCSGGSGEFHLTRRTSGNLTVELYLDVGTWSHQVSAIYIVEGAGFKGSLAIPVAVQAAAGGQYPIGDAAQWQKSLRIWPRWFANWTVVLFQKSSKRPDPRPRGISPTLRMRVAQKSWSGDKDRFRNRQRPGFQGQC